MSNEIIYPIVGGYLMVNLLEKYSEEIQKEYTEAFEKYKTKLKGVKDSHEHLKVGNTIEFISGYNYDIKYTTKILGFDSEGDIYVLWDCYWSPIRLSDPNRKIIVIEV